MTGSAASDKAIAWATGRLKDAGLSDVRAEPVALEARWLPGREEAVCRTPAGFPVRVAQVPLAPPTSGRVEASLVVVEPGAPLAAASGRVVLFRRDPGAPGDGPAGEGEVRSLLAATAKAGAVAALLESRRPGSSRERLHPGGTAPLPLPAAVVPRPDAGRLARLAARGDVTVALQLDGHDHGPGVSANVVGDLPGRDPDAGVVLLATHLDSWDLGTGAIDSGVNVVTLLAAGRALAAQRARPRATLRLVFFTGEEQDRLGSRAYVAAHAAELRRNAAALLLDLGTGRIVGFLVNGRRDLEPRLLGALARHAPDRGFPMTRRPYLGSDDRPLVEAGVAAAVADQERAPGTDAMHTEDDVADRADLAAARENARLLAAVAWDLAARPPAPAGPHR